MDTLRNALRIAFTPPARRRSLLLLGGLGVPLTIGYLVALPAGRYGAFSWSALQLLTPGEALASLIVGIGVSLTFALNAVRPHGGRGPATLSLSGILAALLPSSLCCTSLIPSALAAAGASAPAVLRLSGRYASFFARDAGVFVGVAVAAVLVSLWLAARSATAVCPVSEVASTHPSWRKEASS
jgi:hypothetical protein